ncbi:MAG: DAK2 domain-containing protein [Clostridia bacterium]|nr:DAK2 domain-containing protein [Clostridia bacterium]
MITGSMLRDAVISASNNINNNRKAVDALNVFPVPDGDTGTNMSMTMSAAAREVARIDDSSSVSTVADVTASALLRGARGNSGVILSLIFRGIAKGLKGCNQANGATIAAALTIGVDAAYKAVMKPTEGTILTVVRMAAEQATEVAANGDASFIDVWDSVCTSAQDALDKTPSMLPVLKKAGVVDAGGQGLVLIFNGMKSFFEDSIIISCTDEGTVPVSEPERKDVVANADIDIEFGYCTEFIVNRDSSVTRDPMSLRAYLESIGDCVVVVDDESIIKVHVHSNEPGNAIQEGIKFGSLINIKIENMRQQHVNASWGASANSQIPAEPQFPRVEPENEYGFVAVAAGDGIAQLFSEIGVDVVVSGGQTMNPSTEDILKAVMATPAKTVFVLPNNKNIIMAAEQVIPLADRDVIVLQTKTIPQGISAMLSFDSDAEVTENHLTMSKAIEDVLSASVTFAARDSSVNGQQIKQGQILGMEEGKITVVDDDIVRTAYKVTRRMVKKHANVITILYGNDTTPEQADQLYKMISDKYPSLEVSIIDGGQPVYHFIISIE